MHGKAGMPEDLVEALKRKEPAAFEWLMARMARCCTGWRAA